MDQKQGKCTLRILEPMWINFLSLYRTAVTTPRANSARNVKQVTLAMRPEEHPTIAGKATVLWAVFAIAAELFIPAVLMGAAVPAK